MGKIYENKNNEPENKNEINKDKIQNDKNKEKNDSFQKTNSLLFSNINNIYDSFNLLMKNTQTLFFSLQNDLVIPLDDFIQNQLNFYKKKITKKKTNNTSPQA